MNKKEIYDVIIIGAGPAGLTAAVYTSRSELKTLIIEASAPGGKVTNTAVVENYPGFDKITGPELAMKIMAQAKLNGAKMKMAKVEKIVDNGKTKTIHTNNGNFETKTIIIGTGTNSRKLGVEGEDKYFNRGLSYCAICDGALHKGKSVVLIGGGNSAVEESITIEGYASKVYIVQLGDKLTAEQRIINTASKLDKINILLNKETLEVIGDDTKVTGLRIRDVKTQKEEVLEVSGIFPYIGAIPVTEFVKDLEITNKFGYIEVDELMKTKIPGIYAIGDVNDKHVRQITTAVADGTIAALNIKGYISENY